MDTEENIAKFVQLQRETSEAGLSFVKTELDTSLTFANLALQAGDDTEKKDRNRTNARRGYETILQFIDRFDANTLSEAEIAEMKSKFVQLKTTLERLGETLR